MRMGLCMRMRNRIVDVMHGCGFEFRICKYSFCKFLILLIRKNKVKYKFPHIWHLVVFPYPFSG